MRKNLLLAAMIAALAFAGVACSDDDTVTDDEGTGTEVEETEDTGVIDEATEEVTEDAAGDAAGEATEEATE